MNLIGRSLHFPDEVWEDKEIVFVKGHPIYPNVYVPNKEIAFITNV